MPDRPIQAAESFADLAFPPRGLDLSRGYGSQQPGTTRVGVNVRVYEPTTSRARGGQRPGLFPYLPVEVPSGPHLIQHLNFVISTSPDATLDGGYDYGDGAGESAGDGVADPSTPGRFYGPEDEEDEFPFDDDVPEIDPDDPDAPPNRRGRDRARRQQLARARQRDRARGRRIRPGGSGRAPSRQRTRKKVPVIEWADPLDIKYGTPLTDIQLNAQAFAPGILHTPLEGTYAYTPDFGTILPVGNSFPLFVRFRPTDSNRYGQLTAMVKINVLNNPDVPDDPTIGMLIVSHNIEFPAPGCVGPVWLSSHAEELSENLSSGNWTLGGPCTPLNTP